MAGRFWNDDKILFSSEDEDGLDSPFSCPREWPPWLSQRSWRFPSVCQSSGYSYHRTGAAVAAPSRTARDECWCQVWIQKLETCDQAQIPPHHHLWNDDCYWHANDELMTIVISSFRVDWLDGILVFVWLDSRIRVTPTELWSVESVVRIKSVSRLQVLFVHIQIFCRPWAASSAAVQKYCEKFRLALAGCMAWWCAGRLCGTRQDKGETFTNILCSSSFV